MPRFLVVGGGPAGSATAFWLAKAGFQVVVAERSTVEPYGQGIDITGEAVDVVKRMGLYDEIRRNTTGETGFSLVDDEARVIASLGAEPAEGGGFGSPTNEIEIMRGTLVNIFADAAKREGAQYRYGCTVNDIQQHKDSVTVDLSGQSEKFTAVIGADGIASRVRRLAFDQRANDTCYAQTDTYVAYYSMETDKPVANSKGQNANNGRVIWIRPINNTRESCYLLINSPDNARLSQTARTGSVEQQKALMEELFDDVGGLRDTAIKGMHASRDFYFCRVAQIKLDSWHSGRCALVGDAGYCPSPLTGQGTAIAVLGAYILAGELARNPADPVAAFVEYRRRFENFVKEEGAIPLGGYMPRIFAPQSDLAIWLLRSAFKLAASPVIQRIFYSLPPLPTFGEQAQSHGNIWLPKYEFERVKQ